MTDDFDSLPESLRCDEFAIAWANWQRHRREINKPLRHTQIVKQIEQFSTWGVERSVAAINFTITKGWQGIREPDNSANGQHDADPRGNLATAERYLKRLRESQ